MLHDVSNEPQERRVHRWEDMGYSTGFSEVTGVSPSLTVFRVVFCRRI